MQEGHIPKAAKYTYQNEAIAGKNHKSQTGTVYVCGEGNIKKLC